MKTSAIIFCTPDAKASARGLAVSATGEHPGCTNTDGQMGMAWWNNLAPIDRGFWLLVSNSAAPADAWEAFKASEDFTF